MEKKYIIELNPDCVEGEYLRIPARIAGEQQWLMTKAALTPCTELDLEQVRKEAYEDGLKDAWEAAKKIALMDTETSENVTGYFGLFRIMDNLTASEVIAKIKEYEDGKQEIKVGDEVGYYGVADEHGNVNYSGVVLEIKKDDYLVMEKDGRTYQLQKKLVMSKTGRHFPEIAAVLEKMRGEQE